MSNINIRKLVDPISGEQFYPQTDINGLVNNGDSGVDEEPVAGSSNLVKSGGVQNELALGAVYDVSAKNPTAGPNSNGKWGSLSALLSDANLNTLIPTAVRKGGMSMKFIQTSDNKYLQYRCMAQNFTTNTTQWAIAEEGVYVENPEYVYVKTDKDGKILWGIEKNGNIHYGAGVPQQVIDYINEKIAELSLDEYENIVAFLNGLEEGDKTLQQLFNEKVDKEEGKSLIDKDVAESFHYIDNLEYAKVFVDKNGKIYFGVKHTGEFFFGEGCPRQVREYIQEKLREVILKIEEDNSTLVELISGKEDKEEGKGLIDSVYSESISTTNNPEYCKVLVDNNNKIIEGIKSDGTKFVNIPINLFNVSAISAINSPEWIKVFTDKNGKIVYGIKENGEVVIYALDNPTVKEHSKKIDEIITSLNKLTPTVQNLYDAPMASFRFDSSLLSVTDEMNGIDMTAVDSLGCETFQDQIYSKIDALVTAHSDVLERIDLAEFVNEEYPEYANLNGEASGDYAATPSYKTYMYKYYRRDGVANSGCTATKKKVFIVAGIHGWENASQLNTFIFLSQLCKTANIDYMSLASACDFYIIPCLNGYGAYHHLRKNANGVDINRNFPGKNWVHVTDPDNINYGGEEPLSEFETKLVVKAVNLIRPDVFIDHHSYGSGSGYNFYVDLTSDNQKKILYDVFFDWTYRASTDYPDEFGDTYKATPHSFNTNIEDNGISKDWACNDGVADSLTIEVCICTTRLTPSGGNYSIPIVRMNELMLRLALERIISFQLKNNIVTI